MDLMIVQTSVTLFEILCVIIVFAFILIRSRFFIEVFENRPTVTTRVILIVFFGLVSIFGTLSGLSIFGAVVNIRDLGPMAAGLLCGPYVGLGAGIIGGLFRFAQGGPYIWTGLSAPILSGILGGILYLANGRRFVPTWMAALYIGLSETLISCYTLVLVTRPAEFVTVVTNVAIPMIVYNVIGMLIFASVVHWILGERESREKLRMLELELASKKNLSMIINTIPYPVFVLDRDQQFIHINDSLCHFFGIPEDRILGRTPRDLLDSKETGFHWKITGTSFPRNETREDEVAITLSGGQVLTVVTTTARYTDLSGQDYIVGVLQDVTERVKMQEALRQSEEWYRILFEHTGTATQIVREDSIIDQANSEFCRLFGYSREEIEGRMSIRDVTFPDDRDMVTRFHTARRIDPASAPSSYTVRLIARNGTVIPMHAVVAMIPGTRKSIAAFVDISEQKKYEEALILANRKLNLLSSITRHDIINQLMILKGYLEMARMKEDKPDILSFLAHSDLATRNIEHQITFTRDYQDMGVKAPSWHRVRGAVVAAKGALTPGSVSVELQQPDVELFVDPLFEKVFYNLIDNSLRYGGKKLTSIRISSREQEDGSLLVIYHDDGEGIADTDREHIFEQGFGKHTGFGLFLTREILSITGISIRETGRQGTCARFEIHVPNGAWRYADPGQGNGPAQ